MCGRRPMRHGSPAAVVCRGPYRAAERLAVGWFLRIRRRDLTARRAEAIATVTRMGGDRLRAPVGVSRLGRGPPPGGIAHGWPKTPLETLCRDPWDNDRAQNAFRAVAAHGALGETLASVPSRMRVRLGRDAPAALDSPSAAVDDQRRAAAMRKGRRSRGCHDRPAGVRASGVTVRAIRYVAAPRAPTTLRMPRSTASSGAMRAG